MELLFGWQGMLGDEQHEEGSIKIYNCASTEEDFFTANYPQVTPSTSLPGSTPF